MVDAPTVLPSGKPTSRAPLWQPGRGAIAATQLSRFIRFCESSTGLVSDGYPAFERWCIDEAPRFWTLFLEWSELPCTGATRPAIEGGDCEHAGFFPGLSLNYAGCLLHGAMPSARPALTILRAGRPAERWSRGELRSRVQALSAAFAGRGLGPGHTIAILAPNSSGAIVGALAASAIGCTVCTAAPDMASFALLSRFGPVRPSLLLAELSDPGTPAGRAQAARIAEVVRGLPSLQAVVRLDDAPDAPLDAPALLRASALLDACRGRTPAWPQLPFNHPLFVLFTSGTTGLPKCLVHGAGGTLVEHVKEHRLHCDLGSRDKLFFHTSTGWMMWNWQLSALASGTELVLYDGPIGGPETLWRIVARERVTVFGTSPAYLQLCERGDWSPPAEPGFEALRAVLSTGSILYPRQQEWLWDRIKPLPVQSISGGTDIVGCFVLGNPNLPAFSGEPQCRSLGLDVRAVTRDGAAIGELVCANPFPSRPLGLLDDPDRGRFHEAYFARHPRVWAHGDLVEFTAEGSVRMHGRCDGVLNIHGVRIGPAEIYRILDAVPEVAEALTVEQRAPDEPGGARMVLLVVLRAGSVLDPVLAGRIRKELAMRGSSAHVPAQILALEELPTTHSGKRSERSARDALDGRPVANLESLRNPRSLDPLIAFAARPGEAVRSEAAADDVAHAVTRIWEGVLGITPIGADDNYFDLGGDSLKGLQILARVREATGFELPLNALLEAPTVATLSAALQRGRKPAYQALVQLAAGAGTPLFLVHGVGGSVMELRALVRDLRLRCPVYALQARGYDPGDSPWNAIEEMAHAYVDAIRGVCPYGPWRIVGLSFGGLVAWEMARVLRGRDGQVALLALLDTQLPERHWSAVAWAEYFSRRLRVGMTRLGQLGPAAQLVQARGLGRALLKRVLRAQTAPDRLTDDMRGSGALPPAVRRVRAAGIAAAQAYDPPSARHQPVVLFRSELDLSPSCDPAIPWRRRTSHLEVIDVPGDHAGMLRAPQRAVLAQKLAEVVERAAPAEKSLFKAA